ncbi:MAG: Single-stranded nucleic acid binding R3H domain protein [Candidatus Woesebacteria bacterium GW2011_GWA1_33_30]|uniref:Single-stranded nucleic acid binding R3H domain protein n=1 Tax=Candidatus Woesebacteria bacterium GW2011_GWA2_33_28 TaxID=1618561 RepID=A0A0G0C5K4_9BACT|nr:MAG: Single-stranded nucleic acid binding R3H domain protein [Candidatus Woesebacteria bacterium GW2011_GWA2_33_28]KKP47290.1 MAG: Single-stranded nucleic acid binding R3H domain protein [Candidatus Woesebacteria bacterium GW2011_GWA1_33_30]KKP48935.1 MAG: Single-stranded nucleic acid binding R3H domain protein [Microgenomates group bacterium GW2011_GWC1_33_32]KKP51473.1 MAG: Single-stranded nucleic acid binding R3H domain protein [Candidatus Woesebacteria bacterium GW2011_GWB1_33_38]KKP5747
MNTVETIESLTKELFSLAGVDVKVTVEESEEGNYEVNLETIEETGLLIGFRGENINAIQTVLGIMVKGVTGEWVRILVNIGDYRQKQEEKLFVLADQSADRAIETKEPQPIYNLTAGQRRTIHMYLSKRDDIVTESQGENLERFLVVKSK